MTATYWVWRRELAVMLRAPVVYVVGGLFLVVQGVAFAGLIGALSDPRRPAPLGALLEGQLAGTLLTWVLELVVLTLLGMRAIAEDKRSGSWELLLTAGVGEGAAVAGKWLAATTLYAVVWLPTLAYFGVVAVYRADAGGWDVAATITGYAGAIVLGAALLAWAIAASAATSSVLAAGALGFALLILVFLTGELAALWPDLAAEHATLAAVLEAVSLRAIAGELARGYLGVRAVVVLAGLTVVGLSLAVALACAGRRRRAEVQLRVLGAIAWAVIAVLAGVLAARHPAGLDVSRGRRSTLDEATRAVLADLPGSAVLTIVSPTLAALEPVYDEVARIAGRFADESRGVTVRRADPLTAPGGMATLAREAGLQPGDLASTGAVIVELAGRRRVVDLPAFATLAAGGGGGAVVERLAVEQTLAGALASLAMVQPVTVCATRGHGELPAAAHPGGRDWAALAGRLRGDGIAIEDVDVVPAVPTRCAAVFVAGPTSTFSGEEALALQAYVRGGGGLVVAATVTDDGALPATGLDGLLAADGLGLPSAVVVDPALAVPDRPNAVRVVDGYVGSATSAGASVAAINRGFARVRPTLWHRARAVATTRGAQPLIAATSASWGERDLFASPVKDPDDLAGPVVVAALGSAHRVIAIGSMESVSTARLGDGWSGVDLWFARAIRYAAGAAEPSVAAVERSPEQVRLVMTASERRQVIAISVAGVPLAWAVLGGLVVWWRRRRA